MLEEWFRTTRRLIQPAEVLGHALSPLRLPLRPAPDAEPVHHRLGDERGADVFVGFALLAERIRRQGCRVNHAIRVPKLAGARQLEFVVADDRPVLITGGATPFQDRGVALDDGFQLHFGVGAAERALFRNV